ncbi:hypothetical protein DFH07DRAFT_1062089, partial [Mycena maculata]
SPPTRILFLSLIIHEYGLQKAQNTCSQFAKGWCAPLFFFRRNTPDNHRPLAALSSPRRFRWQRQSHLDRNLVVPNGTLRPDRRTLFYLLDSQSTKAPFHLRCWTHAIPIS